MQYREIMEMVREIAGLGASSFAYTEGDIHVSIHFAETMQEGIRTAPACTSPQTNPEGKTQQAPQGGSEREDDGTLVRSPLVGTFYAAPSEDSAPFVQIGDRVKKGQTLAIVEAMKLMNEIESEFDGTVEAVLTENHSPVEYGQPLFRIREDSGRAQENS